MKTYFVAALIFLLHGIVHAQSDRSNTFKQSTRDDEALEQRIDNDVSAYDAWREALLQDRERIQELRRLGRDRQFNSGYGSAASSARVTLARLGDKNELEKIVCEAYSKDPNVQFFGIRKIEDVGGYASIKALADVLLRDPPMKPMGGDTAYIALRRYAMKSLSNLVPEMRIPITTVLVPSSISDEQARDWYNWIMSHRDQLGRLQPNETVDIDTKTCAERKKKYKASPNATSANR